MDLCNDVLEFSSVLRKILGEKMINDNSEYSGQKDKVKALENLREKLLDFTMRNTLLNFRDTGAKVVKIIDELPEQVYDCLVNNDTSMVLDPLYDYEPEKNSDNAEIKEEDSNSKIVTSSDAASNSTKSAIETINQADEDYQNESKAIIEDIEELPDSRSEEYIAENKHQDDRLQTSLKAKNYEGRMRQIYSDYNKYIDSAGSNMLFMAIGFLQWYNPKSDKDKARLAPLVLIPVDISKVQTEIERPVYDDLGEMEGYQTININSYSVSYSGDSITDNLVLKKWMDNYNSFTLPELGEDLENLEEYFDKINNLLSAYPAPTEKKWRVIRQIRIGFFTYTKDVMYKDLDVKLWENGNLLNNDNVATALVGKNKEESEISQTSILDNEVEACHKENRIPTVLDADSSQMKVLMRIDNGENLVVQGPPGTGKSQTIANMIATAIHSGKKVLFVAEKLAALNVVASRLSNVGLSEFCLELHSNKLSPKSVLGQINSRVAISYDKQIQSVSRHLEKLNIERKCLESNCDIMKKYIPELEMSVHDVIWQADSTKCKIEKYCHSSILQLPKISDTDKIMKKEELQSIHRKFETLEQLWDEGMPQKAECWQGFILNKRINHSHSEIIKQYLIKANQYQNELVLEVSKHQSIPLLTNASIVNLAEWYEKFNELSLIPDSYLNHIGHCIASSKTSIEEIQQFLSVLEKYLKFSGSYVERIGKRTELQNIQIQTGIESINSIVENFPLASSFTSENIGKVIQDIKDITSFCNELNALCSELVGFINTENTEFNINLIVQHTEMFDYILSLDIDVVNAVSPICFTSNISRYLEKAKSEANELCIERERLNQIFNIDDISDSMDLKQLKLELKQVQDSFFSWLPFGHKADVKRRARLISTKKLDILSDTYINNMDKISELLKAEDNLLNNTTYIEMLSDLYKGVDTDWELLENCIEVAHKFKSDYPQESIHNNILNNIKDIHKRYDEIETKVNNCKKLISNITDLLPKHPEFSVSEVNALTLTNLETLSIEVSELLDNYLSKILVVSPGINCELSELKEILHYSLEWRLYYTEITAMLRNMNGFGVNYIEPEDCNAIDITVSLDWIIECRKLIPHELTSWILFKDTESRFSSFSDILQTCNRFIEQQTTELDKLSQFGELTQDSLISPLNPKLSLKQRYDYIKTAISCCKYLTAWSDYQFTLNWFNNDYTNLLDFAVKHKLNGEALQIIVEAAFYNRWVTIIFDERFPDMWDFVRAEHEVSREHFKNYDRNLFPLNQKIIKKKVLESINNTSSKFIGNSKGIVSTYTGMGLINRELAKKIRHVPVRSLVKRSGHAIQSLMPCWMMSPASVAQFLPPEEIEFDIVIMDEASQIRPEEAIGALARAKQAVIVGDSNQMPPTNVFSSKLNDEEADDSYGSEDMKSILDRMCSNFNEEWLRWHYRSQCQDLISFSNDKYYDSRLIIPPAAFTHSPDAGIKLVYCESARYHDGVNELEAETIVNFVKDHIIANSKRPPKEQESLGVVALNKKQAAVIEEAIDNLKLNSKEFEIACRTFSQDESLFVRNLENVQGDERDIIAIGVTYGPNINNGRVYQNFGPINSAGGWRRLNVLFTRSRKRVHIFTSMKSSDIQVPAIKDGERSGRADLKAYLEFAETGNLPNYGVSVSDNTDSPFEDAVLHELRKAGFAAHTQIGVDGFKIDIGVVDPDSSGKYICGIECDGATYHSSLIARDRDRLRQEILESRGWNIYRIWSTDWFKNRDTEITRMIEHLHLLSRVNLH